MTVGRQLVPHRRIERAVMQAGGEQARGMAKGFNLAVAGYLSEGAVDGADVLPCVGDQDAFGGAFEHRGGLLQFFLHQLAFGDVPGDGQHAIFVANRQWAAGHFAQANLAVGTTDMTDEIAHKAVALHQLQHVFAFVEVDPDA